MRQFTIILLYLLIAAPTWAAESATATFPEYNYKLFCKAYGTFFDNKNFVISSCLKREENTLKELASGLKTSAEDFEQCKHDMQKVGESYYYLKACLDFATEKFKTESAVPSQQEKVEQPAPLPLATVTPATKTAHDEKKVEGPRPLKDNEQAFLDETLKRAFPPNYKKVSKLLKLEWKGTSEKDVIVGVVFTKEAPKKMKDVEDVGQLIMEGMIETLVKWGYEPSKSNLNIFCMMYSKEKGLSGKPLVRMYGQTNYSNGLDSAVFMPAK